MTPVLKYVVGQILIVLLFLAGLVGGLGQSAEKPHPPLQATMAELSLRLQDLRQRPEASAEVWALEGMIEGLKSRDARSSGDKVKHLKRCLELLDLGIKEDPSNGIVRSYHATLESNIPRFFRNPKVIRDDLRVIRESLASGYVSRDRVRPLTPEDRALLHSALQCWKHSTIGRTSEASHVD